jgi:ribosomal-protein-alanine N-acetyltransferase
MRQPNCVSRVVECDKSVVGFIIYELHVGRYEVLHMAVHPQHRRRGVGTMLLQELITRTGPNRKWVHVVVPEANMPMLSLLRSTGFLASGVSREFFGVDDGIDMNYIVDSNQQSHS